MPIECEGVTEVYMKDNVGQWERVNLRPVEITSSEDVGINADTIHRLKEASFTTEIHMRMDAMYAVFGRYIATNNWLKMHGIPMRRKFEKNLCASRKRRDR